MSINLPKVMYLSSRCIFLREKNIHICGSKLHTKVLSFTLTDHKTKMDLAKLTNQCHRQNDSSKSEPQM